MGFICLAISQSPRQSSLFIDNIFSVPCYRTEVTTRWQSLSFECHRFQQRACRLTLAQHGVSHYDIVFAQLFCEDVLYPDIDPKARDCVCLTLCNTGQGLLLSQQQRRWIQKKKFKSSHRESSTVMLVSTLSSDCKNVLGLSPDLGPDLAFIIQKTGNR